MNSTTMVVLIVCVVSVVLYKMFNKYLEFKAKKIEHNNNADHKTDELIKEIQALNERIQVLESIVTEEGYQVQKDINQL
ncbi:MAG: phage shock protein C [Colwellia sp.]|jgi:phage shock protein C